LSFARFAALACLSVALSGCVTTPPLSADRSDLPFAQVITIRSQADRNVLVRRAIANDRPQDQLCVRALEDTLAPGAELTVTFIGCGKVRTLIVHTDRGLNRFDFTD
jgi:hypothetical protein